MNTLEFKTYEEFVEDKKDTDKSKGTVVLDDDWER